MKKDERLIYFYDLTVAAGSRTFDAPKTISVSKAFELIDLIPLDKRTRDTRSGDETLYIADWSQTADTICLLVNKSDKAIADPVFTIPKRNMRRTANKSNDEGQDFSAHLVIKLQKNPSAPALAILEYCSGLGPFVVEKLLNRLLREAENLSPSDFSHPHPDGSVDRNGKPKTYNCRYKFEFEGHISDDLKNDLNLGKIQSIELIEEKQKSKDFDDEGNFQERSRSVAITLKDEKSTNKFHRITKMLKSQQDNYEQARIKFKTKEGIDRSVNMTLDGIAEGYVKRGKLEGFGHELEGSYDKFCQPILSKMKELLI